MSTQRYSVTPNPIETFLVWAKSGEITISKIRRRSIPETLLGGAIPDYDDFLEERRKLIAFEIKSWFEALS